MAMKQGHCPQCEKHVEWQSVASASGILYRCSNCWYHLDAAQMKNIDQLGEKLAALDAQREELLAAHR